MHGTLIGARVGAAIGTCAYTFIYAKGYSCLVDKPEACATLPWTH